MKKVIIFTYYWPPAGGVAVQRWLKFSKYLPEFGWEPIIVTVENGSYPYYDKSLLNEVNSDLCVYKTKTFEPFAVYNFLRGQSGNNVPTQVISDSKKKSFVQKLSEYIRANFFVPDARKGWVKYAVKKGEEIINNEEIAAVVTTGPPHSAHLIGLKLKDKFGLPWIADFRDPWTEIFYNRYLSRTKFAQNRDKKLETRVLEHADVVITISNGMKKMFVDRCKRCEMLPNGFDMTDLPISIEQPINPKFVLGHIGSYVAALDSEGLYKALKELLDNEPGFKENFCLNFTGKVDSTILEKFDSYGIKDVMNFENFVTHREAIRRMYDANLLLLVLANVPDNKYLVSGKLFEYLASSTPILGIATTMGDANDVLVELGRESILDYQDSKAIKQVILKYYNQWKNNNGVTVKIDTTNVQQYSRKEITKRLSHILNEITD